MIHMRIELTRAESLCSTPGFSLGGNNMGYGDGMQNMANTNGFGHDMGMGGNFGQFD